MNTDKEIFEKIGKGSYGIPDGYFNDLKTRLAAIPDEKKAVDPGFWMRVRPYAALAACFTAILLAGNAVLHNTALKQKSADQYQSEISYADMISITRPEIIYTEMDYDHADISDEDIINYLIETGATMEHLAYAGGQ